MRTVFRGEVLDQWSNLLEGCQGSSEQVLQAVERNLHEAQAPGVTWKREAVAPNWLKGFGGGRRDFLSITSPNFSKHLMLVNAGDFGNNLNVAWYLAVRPPMSLLAGCSILAISPFLLFTPLLVLAVIGYRHAHPPDLFQQQDLQAFVTVGHSAVLKAVEKLMNDKEIDLARLQRQSQKGFVAA